MPGHRRCQSEPYLWRGKPAEVSAAPVAPECFVSQTPFALMCVLGADYC